jgi:diguanylate cyclase
MGSRQRTLARRRNGRPRAVHDPLTGTAARPVLRDHLGCLLGSDRTRGEVALVRLHVDQLPDDNLPPHVEEAALIEVADRLRHASRATDLVCRYGRAEFAIVAERVDGVSGAAVVADRLLAAVRDPVVVAGTTLTLSASAGIAMADPTAGQDAAAGSACRTAIDDLLTASAGAMATARAAGGDTYRVAEPAGPDTTSVDDLRRGLARDQFLLAHQPQVDLRTGRVVGAEALLRWRCDRRPTPLHAGEFLALANGTDVDLALGRWTLHAAIADLAGWHARDGRPDLSVSVNVSTHHLLRGDLLADVKDALSHHNVDARHLELEVPERAIGRAAAEAADVLRRVASLGVRVAVDGFGMGQSSLALLPELPITTLKLDDTLGDRMAGSGAGLVAGLVGLARELRLQVVVPRIEHVGQLRRARQLGCDRAQGRLLSPPLPADRVLPGPPRDLADHHPLGIRRG